MGLCLKVGLTASAPITPSNLISHYDKEISRSPSSTLGCTERMVPEQVMHRRYKRMHAIGGLHDYQKLCESAISICGSPTYTNLRGPGSRDLLQSRPKTVLFPHTIRSSKQPAACIVSSLSRLCHRRAFLPWWHRSGVRNDGGFSVIEEATESGEGFVAVVDTFEEKRQRL